MGATKYAAYRYHTLMMIIELLKYNYDLVNWCATVIVNKVIDYDRRIASGFLLCWMFVLVYLFVYLLYKCITYKGHIKHNKYK